MQKYVMASCSYYGVRKYPVHFQASDQMLDKVRLIQFFHSDPVQWKVPATVLLLSFLATFTGEGTSQLMMYERNEVLSGEFWRLITAHLVHAGLWHWFLNASVLVILWWAFGEKWMRWRGILLLVFLATMVGAGIFIFNTGLQWYVGLSGVLHGLLITGAFQMVLAGRREYLLIAGILLVKLTYEQLSGPLPTSEIFVSVPVIIDAHLYGAIAGVIAALYLHRGYCSEISNT